MEELFQAGVKPDYPPPLAERMRPANLDEFVGQRKLLGEDGILGEIIHRGFIPSMIFWGEPGCGKTSLARLIARKEGVELRELSAVDSGVRDLREVIEYGRWLKSSSGKRCILFIDEIHRFSKSQQDALLHAVEDGTLTLIGATTENPSFEIIPPLLSRARVLRFEPLDKDDLQKLLERALKEDSCLSQINLELETGAKETLIRYSGGDARIMLNALELAVELADEVQSKKLIDEGLAERALQQRAVYHDKKGDYHYDLASAFIKSMRASDPDAALFYMAKMLAGGEDPKFIARRMIVLASEDIGNANPQALVLANACFQAIDVIGMPEARIILSQTCVYLASSPKSNASYLAIDQALEDATKLADVTVPLKLRNPVTGYMNAWGYGKDYYYPHNFPEHFLEDSALPDKIKDKIYYRPTEIGNEKAIKERLEKWWSKRRKSK